MYSEQYEDRKRYADAAKSSFSAIGQKKSYADQEEADRKIQEKEHRSFPGIRFILALGLFLSFFAMKQADFSWKGWNAAKITSQIQNTVDLSKILEQINFLP